MGTEKLETPLEKVGIKQTRDKVEPIRFRDEAINKVKKENYNFGKKRFKYIPFKVSKDSHQKGLKLKIIKGKVGDKIYQGDIIGTVGSTGRSTGPHLDFRINWFQTRLDPMSVIK